MSRLSQRLLALLPVGAELPERSFVFRHRVVLWVAAAHLPALALVGLFAGESSIHLAGELALIGGLVLAGASPRLGRSLRLVFATTALVGSSALLVHLTGGLIEGHFHFFAVVAFVTLYQSWLPFLVAIGWVVLHHGVVGILRPESVYSHPAALQRPALWALVHGGFVLLASLAHLAAWRVAERERLRAESVLAASPQPTYGVDTDGRIVFANRAFTEFVGRGEGSVLGEDDHELLHAGAEDCTLCAVVRSGATHRLDQVELFDGRGDAFPAELHVRPFRERGRLLGSVVTFWDVSERLAHRRELEQHALTDTLTGLANRTLLRDRLAHATRSLRRTSDGVAVVFLDLDRFKPVNDVLGHRAGDELLVEVAARLTETSRPGDTVGRVGDDEFVVVSPGTASLDDARRIAARFVDAVSRTIDVDGQQLSITASCGVRVAMMVGEDADRLVADADLAMLSAKARGGGQVVLYRPEMREQNGRGLTLGAELHRALQNGELLLHYQPIWSLPDLRPIGAEALVRWNHPTRGLLYPGSFVALAEETGMIGPIGAWVLTESVRQLHAWRVELGPAADDLRMSVNLSVRQLREPTLADQVLAVLDAAEISPDRLCLEITETVLMQEGDGTAEVLASLHDLGIRLAIDDFGTGFSSLATLRRLPVDELKIDRSFVADLSGEGGSEQVVRAIVGLAHELLLSVVAEGVETGDELEAVRHLGCDSAQGYGLARPAQADKVAELLRAHAGDQAAPRAGLLTG